MSLQITNNIKMLYYDGIECNSDVMLQMLNVIMIKLILIRQANQKSVIFVIIGIFLNKGFISNVCMQ